MKAIVTKYLNNRIITPSVNAVNPSYLKPGDLIEVVEIVNGDNIDGNKVWYKTDKGYYVWSGGVEGIDKLNAPQKNVISANKPTGYINTDWSHEDYDIVKLWKIIGNKGKNSKIAVLDSGILKGCSYFDYSKIKGKNIINSEYDYNDKDGHGTAVCSIIAANGGDYVGICPEGSLYISKFLNSGYENNMTQIENLIAALNNVPSENKIIVISYSYFLDEVSSDLLNLLEQTITTVAKDKLILCSNGDDGGEFVKTPANHINVINVAAIDKNKAIYKHSNISNNIFLSAPGVNVKSLDLHNSIKSNFTGSSYSLPFVAGVIGLITSVLIDKDITIDVNLIKEKLLESTTVKIPKTTFGYGIINPMLFYELIKKEYNL